MTTIYTDQYILLVDKDAEIPIHSYGYNQSDRRLDLCTESNYQSIQEHGNKIIGHLPLNNAPVLEGVPLLPPLPQQSNSHNDVYTGIDGMNGKIYRGSKVKVHDNITWYREDNPAGIVTWGKGSYYVDGTFCKYNVYAWREKIEVIENLPLPIENDIEKLAKKMLSDYSQNFKKGMDSGREDKADVAGYIAIKVAVEMYELAKQSGGFSDVLTILENEEYGRGSVDRDEYKMRVIEKIKSLKQSDGYTEEDMKSAFFNGGNFRDNDEWTTYIQSLKQPKQWKFEPEMIDKGEYLAGKAGENEIWAEYPKELNIINNIIQGRYE